MNITYLILIAWRTLHACKDAADLWYLVDESANNRRS